MRQILILTFCLLATASAKADCYEHGQIEHETDGQTLKFYLKSPAWNCDPYDSVSVRWEVHCNPIHQNDAPTYYDLDPGDTLCISYEPWAAVIAKTTFYWSGYQTRWALTLSSNTSIFSTPDRPQLELTVGPNPNDGNFTIWFNGNAVKKRYWIIGGLGLVAVGWQGEGNTQKTFSLHPMNPNGTYEVIADFYFDGCAGVIRTRQKFIVFR